MAPIDWKGRREAAVEREAREAMIERVEAQAEMLAITKSQAPNPRDTMTSWFAGEVLYSYVIAQTTSLCCVCDQTPVTDCTCSASACRACLFEINRSPGYELNGLDCSCVACSRRWREPQEALKEAVRVIRPDLDLRLYAVNEEAFTKLGFIYVSTEQLRL